MATGYASVTDQEMRSIQNTGAAPLTGSLERNRSGNALDTELAHVMTSS